MSTALIVLVALWHVLLLRPDLVWQNDDPYQYLIHARNLAAHQPYAATGYLFWEPAAEIGPIQYPPGWPLLLVPVYLAAGLGSLKPFMALGILVSAASLGVFVAWGRLGRPVAGWPLAVALLALNPAFATYSDSVVSEPLYTFFAMLALYLIDRDDLRGVPRLGPAIGAGVFIGLAWITRSLGIALAVAVVLDAACRGRAHWSRALVTLATAFATSTGVNRAATGTWTGADYSAGFSGYSWLTPLRNARLYAGDLATEFLVPLPNAGLVAKLALLCLLVCAGAGLRRLWRERGGLTVWEGFAAAYLGIVLVWPFYQGTRFLFPILPWIVRTGWIGLSDLSERWPGRVSARTIRRMAAAAILLGYLPALAAEYRARNQPFEDSRSTADVRQVVDFLVTATPPGARLLASRPRALAFLSGRQVAGYPRNPDAAMLTREIREVGAHFLIIDQRSRNDTSIEARVVRHAPSTFERRFLNERFAVFAIR